MHTRRITELADRTTACVALLLAGLHASAAPAGSQARPAECPDGRIADVVIDNHSVFDLDDGGNRRFSWAYRLANNLHARTRGEVVEREILFEIGDCYDVEALRDSERLLRSFEFISNAEVYGIRMPDGQVQVVVDTQDEWSTRIIPRVGSGGLRGVRVVEENLLGTGRRIGLFYDQEEEEGERVYGLEYSTQQLFQTRWNLAVELAKTEAGESYTGSIAYPFVGEVGRWASRQSVERSDRYFELFLPNGGEAPARIWIPVRREHFEIAGAVRRSNVRYRHTMLGVALAGERISYPGDPRPVDNEPGAPVPLAVGTTWQPMSSVRLMLMTGQRNVVFVRRRGLESINGIEDVQLGVEAEAALGPSLPWLSDASDIAAGLGLFAAAEPAEGTILGGQFSVQARRSYESVPDVPEWNDVLAEIDAWAYLRPALESRHTVVAKVSAVGGWSPRAPMQLTLGRDTGLRGYERHLDPGGIRVVGSLEHRAHLPGPFADLFDLGTVLFTDVGKMWPGNVPFGVESPVRASVGFGLRAAFPPGSRQTLQVDVGFPVEGSARFGGPAISIGIGIAADPNGGVRDAQLLRSAPYHLESRDFGYYRPLL